MTPLTAFITGLTTGGLTCFAVQGGLLLGLLAKRDEADGEKTSRLERLFLPVSAFLIAKTVVYGLFGLLLGWFGARIALTDTMKITLQAVAAFVMVIAGVRLIFPQFLPWLSFTAPAPMRRLVRKSARSTLIIAPAILGFLTILIPCGTTQAMEVAAIAAGSPLAGLGIMAGFTLGTFPLFLVIGVLARSSAIFQRRLGYVAALVVIGLGLYSFNGVLVFTGSSYSAQNISSSIARVFSSPKEAVEADTHPVIEVLGTGYVPDEITVPAGESVELTLQTKGRLGCTNIFRIPELNITRSLTENNAATLALNFPKPGRYTFTCGMGMFSGVINAV